MSNDTKNLSNKKHHSWLMTTGNNSVIWSTEWITECRAHRVIEVHVKDL